MVASWNLTKDDYKMFCNAQNRPLFKNQPCGGGVKMAEEQDGEITFSSTNSSKEQQNGEESLQNNF